ncbi:MAG: hypothetical protein AAF327_24210 [Cyanobacteria bacterium P01_A01_bin.37]
MPPSNRAIARILRPSKALKPGHILATSFATCGCLRIDDDVFLLSDVIRIIIVASQGDKITE